MAILSIQTDSIGMAGVVPSFIYIDTTDTISKVTTAGYLDHVVAQGISITSASVAVVTTKASASAPEVANLYTISVSGGVITLTEIVTGGGGGGGGLTWVVNSGSSITMVSGMGYIATASGAVTLNLPSSATPGQVFGVAGVGAGLFTVITPGGSLLNISDTSGTHAASQHIGDTLQFVCVATPASSVLSFMAISATGAAFTIT